VLTIILITCWPSNESGVATSGVMGCVAEFSGSRSKAREGQRTPRRCARFGSRRGRASVLTCDSPLPLVAMATDGHTATPPGRRFHPIPKIRLNRFDASSILAS